MKVLETYKSGDVVVIPFPYTDNIEKSKRRPAVVISGGECFNAHSGQLICAMITTGNSSIWPYDVKISEFKKAGLMNACVIRMKLFTIDQRFMQRKVGSLHEQDYHALLKSLQLVLGLPHERQT